MERKLHKPSMREHCRKFLAQTFLGLNYFWLIGLDLEWPDNSLSRNKRGTINNFTEKKNGANPETGAKQGYLRSAREVLSKVAQFWVRHIKASHA